METLIERNGKLYKQIIVEQEIDLAQEEYKLQAWKDALANDAREIAEYEAKLAEIDLLPLDDKYKEMLKMQVTLNSPSGIRQEMIDAQQAIVDNLRNI